ncbi:MAG: hypothetical protein KY447_04140 [Actinobacteria bacterium]|nr:hypothetical protein [Actinomycetota bacterium]
MAWSMHGRHRSTPEPTRWDVPPPVTPDRRARIDAPTAADLLDRRSGGSTPPPPSE